MLIIRFTRISYMRRSYILLTLIPLLILITLPVKADKIVGLGLGLSSAGTEFNSSIASSNARRFIAEQMTLSYFDYSRKNNIIVINKKIQNAVKGIKNKEVIYLRRNGVAVIAEANADVPDYKDAICHRSKHRIRKEAELANMIPKMLKKSIVKLLSSRFKGDFKLSGLSYIKNLKITKWRQKGRYTIRASVCLVDIK